MDQKLKLCIHPLSRNSCLKVRVFQDALNSTCRAMRTTCGQNFSSIWCCLLEPLPNIHQNGQNWILNQKNVVLLLGRFENKKDAETESWHPERLEERFYYRLCENFWKSFSATTVGKFRPSFGRKMIFCLILKEFCDFSGTLDLCYLILLRMQFLRKFWFLAIFLVFQR